MDRTHGEDATAIAKSRPLTPDYAAPVPDATIEINVPAEIRLGQRSLVVDEKHPHEAAEPSLMSLGLGIGPPPLRAAVDEERVLSSSADEGGHADQWREQRGGGVHDKGMVRPYARRGLYPNGQRLGVTS